MRAIAISMVVIAHAMFVFKDYTNSFFDVLHIFGFLGVEIFFVLSGFLIGGMLFKLFRTKVVSFKDLKLFWIRRWFRTLPLYFLFLIVNILIALITGFELPDSLWKYVFFLQNFSDAHIIFFPESWSLSVEEYAYILAPIALYVFYKMFKKVQSFSKEKRFLFTSITLVIVFLISKIVYNTNQEVALQSLELWNSNLKAIVIYRLDAIFYGFILVYYFETFKVSIKMMKNILFLMGLMILLVTVILLPSFGVTIEQYAWYWNICYLPLNSIAIAIMLPYLFYLETSKKTIKKLIQNISVYSYSMYLFHYTCLLYIMDMLVDFENLNLFTRIIWVVVYVLLTYVCSMVLYKYFEKPITDLRDNFRN
jgi:peptidoglycan/LPS O-acetylase OafA/YrhL